MVALGAGLALGAGGAISDEAQASAGQVSAPGATHSWAGRVVMPTTVRRAPRADAPARATIAPRAPLAGGDTVLGVTRTARSADGRIWVEVDLPVRPNGSRGWVAADQLSLYRINTRVRISLRTRTMTLYRDGRVVMRSPVAVGAPATPTPTGRFTVAELVRSNDPKGALGPVILALSAHSDVLNEYAGGNGRVALHGTNAPGLIGTRASNGCVRLRNGDAVKLARLVRPGTPVEIAR